MLFPLVVAFIVTPWSAMRLLGHGHGEEHQAEDRMTAAYRRLMHRLITQPLWTWAFLGGVAVLLLVLAIMTVPTGLVTVKMLPFDNKSELQVVIHMPGNAARTTTATADALAAQSPVTAKWQDTELLGHPSPFTFNGLVRHYFPAARREPLPTSQVTLTSKDERSEQSHDIAKRLRTRLAPVAESLHATIQVVEAPPGPPVLQTIVAEIHGPDPSRRPAHSHRP